MQLLACIYVTYTKCLFIDYTIYITYFYTILIVVLPAVYFKFLQAHATMCLGLYSSYDEECACNYYHYLMRHLSLLHTFCSAADDVWLSFATFGTDSFS